MISNANFGARAMGFEIDFLAVGEGESGGDAVALRYGDLSGPRFSQTVIVIDGGYVESGEKLVEHIGSYYGTDQVDIVVSSHPDRDHIGGLSVVLENLDVTNLLMHLPWNHSDSVAKGLRSGFGTLAVKEKLEKSLSNAAELHDIAKRKGINVIEPFAGVSTRDGSFRIIGPTEAFYEEL